MRRISLVEIGSILGQYNAIYNVRDCKQAISVIGGMEQMTPHKYLEVLLRDQHSTTVLFKREIRWRTHTTLPNRFITDSFDTGLSDTILRFTRMLPDWDNRRIIPNSEPIKLFHTPGQTHSFSGSARAKYKSYPASANKYFKLTFNDSKFRDWSNQIH